MGKDARARAEGYQISPQGVFKSLFRLIRTTTIKKIAINTEFNGYVAVGLLIKGLETANYL